MTKDSVSAQHTPGPNAYDLLLDAPDAQVTRCKLAWKAVAAGEWVDAEHYLRNAAREEAGSAWAAQAEAMADACSRNRSVAC